MPFYCGKRSASICVVLGSAHSSTYSSEYASGCFKSAALHQPAVPLPRDEGLLGQTPSGCDPVQSVLFLISRAIAEQTARFKGV